MKLGPHGRRLVRAGDRFDPPADARQRVRERLAKRLGATAVLGSIAASETTAAAGAGAGAGIATGHGWLTVPLVKWIGAVVIGGVALGGALTVAQPRPARSVTPPAIATVLTKSAPSVSGMTPPMEIPADSSAKVALHETTSAQTPRAHSSPPARLVVEPRGKEAVVESRSAERSAPPAASNATTEATPSLRGEAAVLREAQMARAAGDASRALALLERHAGEYPAGALRDVATTERVLALCALGRETDARAIARSLLQDATFSASPLAPRLRASCAREIP